MAERLEQVYQDLGATLEILDRTNLDWVSEERLRGLAALAKALRMEAEGLQSDASSGAAS